MMLFALVLSALLLAFAAFGLPCMLIGARAFEEFGERPDAQAMAGGSPDCGAALCRSRLDFAGPSGAGVRRDRAGRGVPVPELTRVSR
jgi:hypothetical protein